MPIYEYGCQSCGHALEVSQRLADAPLTTCPSCGKETLEKLISATSFVLKGSGWYKDGYSGKSGEKKRTDNQVTDRLTKAIDDDKKKTDKKTGGEGSGSSGASGDSGGGSTGGPASSSSGAVASSQTAAA